MLFTEIYVIRLKFLNTFNVAHIIHNKISLKFQNKVNFHIISINYLENTIFAMQISIM